jgi:hypothetical protein
MIFLLDTHVHYYENYSLKQWIDSTFENFELHTTLLGYKELTSIAFGIILTERSSENFFNIWKTNKAVAHCSIEYISETCLKVTHNSHRTPLYIYQGQQIKTSEGLEALCISKRTAVPNGLSLIETTQKLLELNEIVVIPWSFGKWIGARRKTVYEAFLNSSKNLFIGDIFGRPRLDSLKYISEKCQKTILCGSDPLPLKEEAFFSATYISVFEIESNTVPTSISLVSLKSPIGSSTLKECSLIGLLYRQIMYRIKNS